MENKAAQKMEQQISDLKEAYQQERQSAIDLAQTAVETSKQAVDFADEWVRFNAWKLLGVTLGLGVVIGLLLRGRSRAPLPQRVPR